jgi:hypothetical protein
VVLVVKRPAAAMFQVRHALESTIHASSATLRLRLY